MYSYILLSLKGGYEKEVLNRLKAMDVVVEAHILFGEWDLIAKVKMDSPENFSSLLMDKVRTWSEVKQTTTMIVAH